MTVKQAAKTLGLTEAAVQYRLRAGTHTASKVPGPNGLRWNITSLARVPRAENGNDDSSPCATNLLIEAARRFPALDDVTVIAVAAFASGVSRTEIATSRVQ